MKNITTFKWRWNFKGYHTIIEAPTFRIAKQILKEIYNENNNQNTRPPGGNGQHSTF